ncbi:MAG: hypothetical protein ACOC4J_04260 [Bacteroidota bacterium]
MKKFPAYAWLGIVLVIVFWFFNWTESGLRTHMLFFPLWLGYILTVDGLVYYRQGNSLITRDFKFFLFLFVLSIPVWWLFELINLRVDNWQYLGRDYFSDFEFAVYSSINFSTVIPAVFVSSELISTIPLFRKINIPLRISNNNHSRIILFLMGWAMLLAWIIWPEIFFPFVWLSLFFILEPLNGWFGYTNILMFTNNKEWRPVVFLFAGALMCGFFWELWNWHAYPKWIYTLPYLDCCSVFEMPLAGFLGYLPFALELFAIVVLFAGIIGKHFNFLFLDNVD